MTSPHDRSPVSHDALPAFGFDQAPYAYGAPQARARFKGKPEDFVVEEVLGFEPSGEGEHLFLFVQTDDHNTRFTVKCLARLFGVPQRAVSYSGLKDRRGLTSQWFSLHLPGKPVEPDAAALMEQGIRLLRHGRHNRKLRIGTHKRNRFVITLRDVSNPDALQARLAPIRTAGVPNYFGAQRFGHHAGNVEEAKRWAALGELPQDKAERSRVLSTVRSWWFNGQLGQRVAANQWQAWQTDDPILLDGSQSFFQEPQWSPELQRRYDEGDIHIGTWLPGPDQPGLPADFAQLLRLAAMKPDPRPLRLLPANIDVQRSSDEQGNEPVVLAFDLPKGAFATAVLREWVQLDDCSGQPAK